MPARSTMMPGRLLFGPTSRVVAGGGRGKTPLAGYATGLERRRVSPRGEPVRFFTKKNTSFSSARLRRAFETTITTRHRASLVTGVAREKHAGKRKEPETTASRCKEREVSRDVPFPRAPEGLDGVELALLHARGVPPPHDGHALSRVNLVRTNGMPVQVADALDWVCLAVELNLVRLHYLLHRGANFPQRHVDAGCGDAGIRRLARRLGQWVKLVVKVHRPRAVDDAAINLRPEIDLHDVALLQHSLVAAIWRVVSRDVVERAARREADAALQATLCNELAVFLLKPLAHVNQLDPRLDEALRIPADLAMHLRRVADAVVQIRLHAVHRTLFLARDPESVEITRVILDLALGEASLCKQPRHRDRGGVGLPVPHVIVDKALDAALRRLRQ